MTDKLIIFHQKGRITFELITMKAFYKKVIVKQNLFRVYSLKLKQDFMSEIEYSATTLRIKFFICEIMFKRKKTKTFKFFASYNPQNSPWHSDNDVAPKKEMNAIPETPK